MRALEAYGELRRGARRVLSTREAATLWRTSTQTAIRRLRAAEEAGLAVRVRRGLWSLDPEIEPRVLAPFLTAPDPAYVSLASALARHGMIEQIPRRVAIASLGRPRRINTSLGIFDIHQLAPELFGGFSGNEADGYLAQPEKALFDAVYVRAASASRAYFPELYLPPGFEPGELRRWSERIASARLRTRVERRLEEVLGDAGQLEAG
jgi:predicted transcriptional regulator of viral defense system